MGLNSTPSSERIQIGFFGRTNTGKSSLINSITNQNISIVSDMKGTTTDPVYKSMELLPLGPVSFIDTAGFEDNSELGNLRAEKTLKILAKTDIAILVVDARNGLTALDKSLIELFQQKNIKYIIAYNKCDLIEIPKNQAKNEIYVSALKKININELKEKIGSFSEKISVENRTIIGDLIKENDRIILVTPIDLSAPKGRLILPQQQVIRDILEHNGICTVVKETQLEDVLKNFPAPKLVITDSQVFKFVNKILPENIALTSFSILFARYKGILQQAINGVKKIDELKDGDTVLISEGCTHHRQCNDIGTVKLPNWIKNYTNRQLQFEFTSGIEFPSDLSKYSMIIHCGGCMLNKREVLWRYELSKRQNIQITNYGILIAYINGILERNIEIFPDIQI